jgi:hypothetical protein
MTQYLWSATIMMPSGNATATVVAPDQWTARKLLEAQYGASSIMGNYVHCVKQLD